MDESERTEVTEIADHLLDKTSKMWARMLLNLADSGLKLVVERREVKGFTTTTYRLEKP